MSSKVENSDLTRSGTLASDSEASSSIGTLILFISIILIASIVATTMINTIMKYQEQAQKTGEETIGDVSTGISCISVTGDRKEDGDPENPTSKQIKVLEIVTRLESGSDPIDFDDVLIQIDNGNKSGELVLNTTGTGPEHADGSKFVVVSLKDPEETMENDNVMTDGTLVKIFISLDQAALDMDLSSNTPVDIKIIPREGHSTPISFTTPSVYSSRKVSIR